MKKHFIFFAMLLLLSFSGCKEKEYDFNNKYFELEPSEEMKVDAFGFNLSEPIRGIAFGDDEIFINTHHEEGYEIKGIVKKKSDWGGYEFGDYNDKKRYFSIYPDSFGFVRYNQIFYKIVNIRESKGLKKKPLPSYDQIKAYVNNGCIIGKVKNTMLAIYEVNVTFDKYVKKKVAEEICNYDTLGRVLSDITYDIEPESQRKILRSKYIHKYDGMREVYCEYEKIGYAETILSNDVFFNPFDRGEKKWEEIYQYNEQNQLIVIERNSKSLNENEVKRKIYSYSQDSLLEEINSFNFKNELITKVKMKYKNGLKTQAIEYSKDGERKRVWTYNDKGFLMSNIPFSNTKETRWGWRQEIEISDIVSLTDFCRNSGMSYLESNEKYILSYDAYGNLLKKNTVYEEIPGRSKEYLGTYVDEYEEIYSYIYDDFENWIKLKIDNSKKEFPVIIERHIDYY